MPRLRTAPSADTPTDRDSAVRTFFATFLDSKVLPDGSVPGYDKWWQSASPEARNAASRHAQILGQRVVNGDHFGNALEEELRACRSAIRSIVPPSDNLELRAATKDLIDSVMRALDATSRV